MSYFFVYNSYNDFTSSCRFLCYIHIISHPADGFRIISAVTCFSKIIILSLLSLGIVAIYWIPASITDEQVIATMPKESSLGIAGFEKEVTVEIIRKIKTN